MTKKLYKLKFDCGRQGNLQGLFIAEEAEVKKAIGRDVNFGDALGKYSEVYGTLDKNEIEIVDVSNSTIEELLNNAGETISGYNPLYYINYECASCRSGYPIDETSYIVGDFSLCDYCLRVEVNTQEGEK